MQVSFWRPVASDLDQSCTRAYCVQRQTADAGSVATQEVLLSACVSCCDVLLFSVAGMAFHLSGCKSKQIEHKETYLYSDLNS
jgi:hypothetical protein